MGKAINSIGNTAAFFPRTLGTGGIVMLDTLKWAGNVLSDMGSVIQQTSSEIKEILTSSRTTGKRYNKLYQVPMGVVASTGTLLEWAVRSVLEPARNAFLNVRDIAGNFFKNIGNTIGRTFDSSKPVSDFSFEHLQTKKATGQNRFSKLAWWKKKAQDPA